jgi:divalent metal cation (Fe/Co/Zn/Cd) transporter
MSETQQAASTTSSSAPAAPTHRARPARWVAGMSLFAGILMIMTGVFNAVEGLVALFRNEVYLTTVQYVFAFDLTTWGWIQLILGLVVLAAGFGVLKGRIWGRVVGIGIALLSMIVNFLFIPYYPVWSLLIIALDVFVIWALCVFNRDAAAQV